MAGTEIFHRIRSCGREFNRDEWHDYLESTNKDKSNRITTTFGSYTFNDHDICITPDVVKIAVKEGSYGYYVEIETAECGNGIWVYGLHYNYGTGGGCWGARWTDKLTDHLGISRGYKSRKEALIDACNNAIGQLNRQMDICTKRDGNNGSLLKRLVQMIKEYKRELKHPAPVELSLF